MDKLADYLIEKETITGKEFMEIFRKEKGLPDPEEKKDEEQGSNVVDITVDDDTPTAKEQEEIKDSEKLVTESVSGEDGESLVTEKPEAMDAPKEENVGRFSNGRL